MTATPATDAVVVPQRGSAGFGPALRSEWIKLRTVRSTWWTLGAMVLLGAGLTTLICAINAGWLAEPGADESPGSFITFGMQLAPFCAIVLGALVVTSEYASGMVRATFTATPRRGVVLAAKAALVALVLLVVGTATALLGYLGGNWFLDREGVGLALEGDVLRAMYGNGLYVAGIGVLAVGVGFLVRHTAGAITGLLAVLLVVGNMALLVPGAVGDWLVRLVPNNSGGAIATPVPFNPDLLDAWTGFGVFAAEVAVVLALAWYAVRRRDA